jgi:hypothetical protein
MKKIVILTTAIILLTSCGAPETAEATITPTSTTTTAVEISSNTTITTRETTAPSTTVTGWTTFDRSEYYKYYNYNDDKTKVYKTLLEALIEKKEYINRLNLQETSYNYLIENVDISDYEVISDVEILHAEIPYYYIDRCEIKVNVTRSDAPNFPVGERIWIIEYNEYAIDDLRDSEYVHTYLSGFNQEELDLRVKTAMYYSISFECFETANVDSFIKTKAEEYGFISDNNFDDYWYSVVIDAMQYTYITKDFLPEPPLYQEDDMSQKYTADYMNKVLHYSLDTDIDMNNYCSEIQDKVWRDWESGGEYGSYEITDDYIEITYYADWSHIVPAKTVRYFFDDSEFPRLERLELIEDFGYEPCTSNPYI